MPKRRLGKHIKSSSETPAFRAIMSLGAEELSWQLQNNDKKGIRL
jgi:hypothetical protein